MVNGIKDIRYELFDNNSSAGYYGLLLRIRFIKSGSCEGNSYSIAASWLDFKSVNVQVL